VLVPGAWLPELRNQADLPLSVRQLTMFWFSPRAGIDPFHPERFPIYICEAPEGPSLYGFPAMGGEAEGVKTAFHNLSIPADPNAKDRHVPSDEEPAMRAAIRRFLPSLEGPLIRTATCLYTQTPDGHFIIDRHPAFGRVVIASCCSGHGFKFCPAIGEALACMAIDQELPVDVSPFRLSRFAGKDSRSRALGS
jgi:sarcosine oxidase